MSVGSDFQQYKLTKKDWEALEVPVSDKEKNILKLVSEGYKNVNIKHNYAMSLLSYTKLSVESYTDEYVNKINIFLFYRYFHKVINKICKKTNIPMNYPKNNNINLKKADIIRLDNTDNQVCYQDNIIEFVLLNLIKKLEKKRCTKNYYTLITLNELAITNKNKHVSKFINMYIKLQTYTKVDIISNVSSILERNESLIKYQDIKLYDHQKELFKLCNRKNEKKIILYQAPTGTGKTISPIALVKNYKVIFVCAARHIGLQLARSCISMNIPIAIGFGCNDACDIKLHYFSAVDYIKNRKTGGIFKVDHSVGNKVEIIICDVASYLPAMYYMLAFNEKESLLTYWDEPTITLDMDHHPLHKTISENWKKNVVKNIILSSATLPSVGDLSGFLKYFEDCKQYIIQSDECNKSIPIISPDGYIEMPHTLFKNRQDLKKSITYCSEKLTLMRHFCLDSISDFLLSAQPYVSRENKIDHYFTYNKDITSVSVKKYYLYVVEYLLLNNWDSLQRINIIRKQKYNSTINISTSDAATLKNGPTIYVCKDPLKIGRFLLQSSKINNSEISNMMSLIKKNNTIKATITKTQQIIEDMPDDNELGITEKKRQLGDLMKKLKELSLNKKYIPNTLEHMYLHHKEVMTDTFTCDISEYDTEYITLLNISSDLKILLLMGIGVLIDENKEYLSIMKKLASTQSLFCIIANSDYIYGTNYQFCHGYLGKDLSDISNEKIIQVLGRVGRVKTSHEYSFRLRDKSMCQRIFLPNEKNKEFEKFNSLFN